jgi:hypothetical protein
MTAAHLRTHLRAPFQARHYDQRPGVSTAVRLAVIRLPRSGIERLSRPGPGPTFPYVAGPVLLRLTTRLPANLAAQYAAALTAMDKAEVVDRARSSPQPAHPAACALQAQSQAQPPARTPAPTSTPRR